MYRSQSTAGIGPLDVDGHLAVVHRRQAVHRERHLLMRTGQRVARVLGRDPGRVGERDRCLRRRDGVASVTARDRRARRWVDRPLEARPGRLHRVLQVIRERQRVADARPEVVVPDRRRRRQEVLRDGQPRAGRRGTADRRVIRRVGRRLEHPVVGLAVAAVAGAGGRLEPEVLGHDAGLVRRVELVGPDLERVADAAGGPERPVLGRARRVVEPEARDVRVAVVRRHVRAERLEERLLEREAVVGDARRPQHEVRERVVGDEVRDVARGLKLADVLDLRLRERRVAAERVAAPEDARARPRPRARRSCGSGRCRAGARPGSCHTSLAVIGRRRHRDGTVLALHLVVEQAEVTEGGRLARDVEAVDVDDRHDDVARRLRRAASSGRTSRSSSAGRTPIPSRARMTATRGRGGRPC